MRNVSPKDKISVEDFSSKLQLKNVSEYLQNRRLQWFGHLETSCFEKEKNAKIS